MKKSQTDEADTRVQFAPAEFYNCDDCEVLPEERWEAYKTQLEDGSEHIIQDRQDVRQSSFSIRNYSFDFRLQKSQKNALTVS